MTASLLILLSLLSGFVVTLINGWGFVYRWNLLVHPAIGLVAAVVVLQPLFLELRHVERRLARATVFLWPLLGFFVLVLLLFKTSFNLFSDVLLVFGFVFFLSLNDLRKLTEPDVRLRAIYLYIVYTLWMLLFFTGLAIILMAQRGGVKYLFQTHLALAIVFVVTFLFELVAPFIKTLNRRFALPPASRATFAMTIVTALVLGGWMMMDRLEQDPSFRVPLSVIPLEFREPQNQQMHFSDPRFEPAGVDLLLSCTRVPGCHQSLEEEYRESNHNISMMTPHFQKNMDALVEEIGFENSMICAGCHFPLAHFDKSKNYRYFKDHDNVSCSFCHIVTDVEVTNEDRRRSSYTLTPPIRHLALFLENGEEKIPDKLTAMQIRLSPLNHGRQFMDPLLREDRFCVACHHHQIALPPEEGLQRPKCITCHMQPQEDLGIPGKLANHFMPGANLTVPYFAGRHRAVERINKWLRGEYLLKMDGWENMWEPRDVRNEDPSKATWLYMVFESLTPPIPGREYTIRILTTNAGMEHPIPAADLALIELWLELTITDADGKIVYQSGALDEGGTIDKEAHKMGGYMIGMDDQVVVKNRVWQIKQKVVHRILNEGSRVYDDFTFAIPDDCRGPLKVVAQWNYYKTNEDFARWVYGPTVRPPLVRIGLLEAPLLLKETPALPDGNQNDEPTH